MTWTIEMDDEYAKAVEWYEDNYYDDVAECKAELKKECERKLAQIREDIEERARTPEMRKNNITFAAREAE